MLVACTLGIQGHAQEKQGAHKASSLEPFSHVGDFSLFRATAVYCVACSVKQPSALGDGQQQSSDKDAVNQSTCEWKNVVEFRKFTFEPLGGNATVMRCRNHRLPADHSWLQA